MPSGGRCQLGWKQGKEFQSLGSKPERAVAVGGHEEGASIDLSRKAYCVGTSFRPVQRPLGETADGEIRKDDKAFTGKECISVTTGEITKGNE